ncbi:MAG: fused MFS/spermidine synthase, partial [Phycisphaerae bacterium]
PTLGAGILLFLVPSVLLGMVTPYAAKLLIQAMPNLGKGVGNVSGVSTLGAILGTIGTTFYLVTWMGTRWLILSNGLVLVGLGLALALAELAARQRAAGSPETPSG